MQAAAALNHHPAPNETPIDVRWMNAGAAALALVFVGLLLGTGLGKLARLPYFTLVRVQLEGELVRNNLATVRANTVPRMMGNFFTVDLAKSREVFEAVPWVRKAVVRRVWPNELRVVLQEHRPAAYWHAGNREDSDDQLVNSFGEVFEANLGDVEDEHLPTLVAPAKRSSDTAAVMLSMLQSLKPVLASLGEVDTLRLTERGSWSVVLSDDASIELGRGNTEEVTARAERFVRTLPSLQRQYPAPLLHADLRYPEGYAVKLRGMTTLQDGAPSKPAPVRKPETSTR